MYEVKFIFRHLNTLIFFGSLGFVVFGIIGIAIGLAFASIFNMTIEQIDFNKNK